MNNYELILVLKGSDDEKKLAPVLEEAKKIITGDKGVVGDLKEWGKKKLASNLKKEEEGVYYDLNFSANSKTNQNLTNKLRINNSVIRFMIKRRKNVKPITK